MSDSGITKDRERFGGKRRFTVFALILSLAVIGVLLRYSYLMFGRDEPLRYSAAKASAGRGPILDRNGRILAMATRLGNVTLWRPEMEDIYSLSAELAPLLEIPAGEIEDRIVNSGSDFLYLKRQVEDVRLKNIESAIAEGRLRGVNIEPVTGRIYPEKNLASQIIGFVGDEGGGLGGIEYAFDEELAPVEGSGFSGDLNARSGNHVFLTLDINVQYMLESLASDLLRDTGAESVMFMAMDPRSGDILGSASVPGFDPNNIRGSGEDTRMDRPAIWAYEPGSVFKVFSMAALMDSGVMDDDTFFVCDGRYERVTRSGETITINCLGAHGEVSPRDIIVYSCNAGAAYAADRLGAGAFYDLLKGFGFGGRTGAGNPGETAGFLRSVERWSERSKPTIAMGQEIAVSAMQMLQAASAVANDGVMVTPRIVLKVNSPDGRITREYSSGSPRRVLQPETARAMRSYMTGVTSSIGTGWRANVEDLSLAVKTGTAQITDSRTGAYSSTDFIASSLAILPAEQPSLILYLVIVKPRGEIMGGRIAAPAIREAAETLINYLGIPRGRNPQIIHSGEVSIPAIPYPAAGETVPDFGGLSKRQLIPLILRDDLNFKILGEGWVRRQSPAPGTPLESDTIITLELE